MPDRRTPIAGDRLTPDLWLIAAAMCVAALVLLAVTLHLDLQAQEGRPPNPGDARAILAVILGAASTVLALIFAVSLPVLSISAGQYGPRLLRRLLRERMAQVTFGLFLATFLFSLLAFGALGLFSHRLALSIQSGNVLARVVDDLARAIEAPGRLPGSRPASAEPDGTAPPSALAARCLESGRIVPAPRSGYVQAIRREALIAAAEREGAVIRIAFRPGHFVATGAALAHVWPAERAEALAPVIRDAVGIGWNRDMAQDPELGIAQLVEIALRAMSAAVNDSFTAIACIDWLSESVASFARIPEPDGAWRDGAAKIRVLEPVLRFDRVAKAAFEQIRQNGTGNIAVTIRPLQAFERLGPLLTSDAQRAAIRAQAEAIREAVAKGGLARGDTADVVSAHSRAKAALEPKQAA